MILRVGMLLALCCALGGGARADEQEDKEARRLYDQGRAAYGKHDFQKAYDAFRQSYLMSQRPELLFNMSSALKALDRPHEAAEELRAYLRLVPAAADRAEIEQRILTLEESQRLLDRERGVRDPASSPEGATAAAPTAPAPARAPEPSAPAATPPTSAPAATPPTSATAAQALVATANPLTAPSPERPRRHLGLAIGLGVGGAILAGVAIGLGVGLSHGAAPAPTSATFGTIRATP